MLPSGFDRADGTTMSYMGVGGTIVTVPAPGIVHQDGQVMAQYPGGEDQDLAGVPVNELPDSPQIERAEQATLTHRFSMSYERAINELQFLGRGTVRVDSQGFYWKVLSASIQRVTPGTAVLTVTEESISFDSPPDQFQITPVELGIHIIKHPRYFEAFLGTGYGSTTDRLNQHVIRLLQDYFENTTVAYRDAIEALLHRSLDYSDTGTLEDTYPDYLPDWKKNGSDSTLKIRGTQKAKRAALEIVLKYWRGEETPYVVGYQITWSQFYFRPPMLNPGGYVEDPVNGSPLPLPFYFWGYPDAESGGLGEPGMTIYDWITLWNPQCYAEDGKRGGPLTISWLRKADEITYERTWFKITRTWIGSPVGFWDRELYNSGDRPSQPEHFLLKQG